jgi:hypothetical protein
MNSTTSKAPHSLRVHIIDVVQQKEGGYTVIVQVPSESEINSAEMWRAVLPGDYRGATRVDRLWHLYYGEDPGYLPGACLDVSVPDSSEDSQAGG